MVYVTTAADALEAIAATTMHSISFRTSPPPSRPVTLTRPFAGLMHAERWLLQHPHHRIAII
jgi:hypothetical protein